MRKVSLLLVLILFVGSLAYFVYDDDPSEITPARGDVVYVEDPRGWRLYYAHLDSTDPAIKPGATVTMGQRIGFIGKQEASGGYVHLHFEIFTRHRASGEWGSEDGQTVWDFGDGTSPVTVQTEGVTDDNRIDGEYATTRHAFDRPGQYIVSVQGTDEHSLTAITHLKVVVGE